MSELLNKPVYEDMSLLIFQEEFRTESAGTMYFEALTINQERHFGQNGVW